MKDGLLSHTLAPSEVRRRERERLEFFNLLEGVGLGSVPVDTLGRGRALKYYISAAGGGT